MHRAVRRFPTVLREAASTLSVSPPLVWSCSFRWSPLTEITRTIETEVGPNSSSYRRAIRDESRLQEIEQYPDHVDRHGNSDHDERVSLVDILDSRNAADPDEPAPENTGDAQN